MCKTFSRLWVATYQRVTRITAVLLLWQRASLLVLTPGAFLSENEEDRPYSIASMTRAVVCLPRLELFLSYGVYYGLLPRNTHVICTTSRALEREFIFQVYGQLLGSYICNLHWRDACVYACFSFVLVFVFRWFSQKCRSLCRRLLTKGSAVLKWTRDGFCRKLSVPLAREYPRTRRAMDLAEKIGTLLMPVAKIMALWYFSPLTIWRAVFCAGVRVHAALGQGADGYSSTMRFTCGQIG